MKIFTIWDCKGTGCNYDWGWRQKEAKTHKKHHSLQVSITACFCDYILDPHTGELNTTAWSSQPIMTDASGLHSQSLYTTLEDVLRKCKSQIASENYLLPCTNLSQFWSLLHGQRGWYKGAVLGGSGQSCTPKNLQWFLSSRLSLTFKILGGQLKSSHGGIKARSFCLFMQNLRHSWLMKCSTQTASVGYDVLLYHILT